MHRLTFQRIQRAENRLYSSFKFVEHTLSLLQFNNGFAVKDTNTLCFEAAPIIPLKFKVN